MRTVWWCLSRSIGYVWTFVELQLQLIPPSALTPTQDTQTLSGDGLNRNYTGNPLTVFSPLRNPGSATVTLHVLNASRMPCSIFYRYWW